MFWCLNCAEIETLKDRLALVTESRDRQTATINRYKKELEEIEKITQELSSSMQEVNQILQKKNDEIQRLQSEKDVLAGALQTEKAKSAVACQSPSKQSETEKQVAALEKKVGQWESDRQRLVNENNRLQSVLTTIGMVANGWNKLP